MRFAKNILTSLFFGLLLVVAPELHAAQNRPLPINWQQPDISLQQVQALFNQNPGFNQFNIRFPNGYMWNAQLNQINSLASSYTQHAQSIGYRGNVPDLSFSSLSNPLRMDGRMSVPLQRLNQNIDAVTQNIMDELNYQKYELANYLPNWLKNLIVMACDGFMILYDFAVEQLSTWMR